jgi:hypothetical protein
MRSFAFSKRAGAALVVWRRALHILGKGLKPLVNPRVHYENWGSMPISGSRQQYPFMPQSIFVNTFMTDVVFMRLLLFINCQNGEAPNPDFFLFTVYSV